MKSPTKKRILNAIDGSIEKWKDVVYRGANDTGGYDCPLCEMFQNDDYSCRISEIFCPIRKITGKAYCKGSPYDKWAWICKFINQSNSNDKEYRHISNKQTQDAANHMLTFLYEVRLKYLVDNFYERQNENKLHKL